MINEGQGAKLIRRSNWRRRLSTADACGLERADHDRERGCRHDGSRECRRAAAWRRACNTRRRPFRLSDARRLGVSRDRLRGSAFRHPTRSVYVSAEIAADLELEAGSWALVLPPSAAMFGTTAAAWYGLPVPRDEAYHVIVPAGDVVPRRRTGLVPHEGLGEHEWSLQRGLRVTTPERTWLDLASVLGRTQLVIAGDAMVSGGLTTVEAIQVVSAVTRRRRGVVLAREAAALVRSGVDSPPETIVRLIIVDGGLPCPQTGLDVYDDGGGWMSRPDLCYLALKLAIQYEGDVH
jgi:hypothetical protein